MAQRLVIFVVQDHCWQSYKRMVHVFSVSLLPPTNALKNGRKIERFEEICRGSGKDFCVFASLNNVLLIALTHSLICFRWYHISFSLIQKEDT